MIETEEGEYNKSISETTAYLKLYIYYIQFHHNVEWLSQNFHKRNNSAVTDIVCAWSRSQGYIDL